MVDTANANSSSLCWQVRSALEVSGLPNPAAWVTSESQILGEAYRHLLLKQEEHENTSVVTNFTQIRVGVVEVRRFRGHEREKKTSLSAGKKLWLSSYSSSKIQYKIATSTSNKAYFCCSVISDIKNMTWGQKWRQEHHDHELLHDCFWGVNINIWRRWNIVFSLW